MLTIWVARGFVLAALCQVLAGCGLSVPDLKEVWDSPEGTKQLEFEIKKRIFCELSAAVRSVNRKYTVQSRSKAGEPLETTAFLPDDWGAQVSLSLQVD